MTKLQNAWLLVAVFFLALWSHSDSAPHTQTRLPKIGVVDMQECLNQYYKTKLEIAKIEAFAKERQAGLDARRADYEALTEAAAEKDKTASDKALSAEVRQSALSELRPIIQERFAKGREIAEAEQKAQFEIRAARQSMEKALIEKLTEVVDAKAAEAGLDMILDRSFLPKANKVIVYTNGNVTDITPAIIEQLNAEAPAEER